MKPRTHTEQRVEPHDEYILPSMRFNASEFYVPQFFPASDVERRVLSYKPEQDCNKPEWNWCGICCALMILKSLGIQNPGIDRMYQVAYEKYKVYRMVEGKVIGAYHKPLAKYMKSEFGLKTEAVQDVDVFDVASFIRGDKVFIASVTPQIRSLDGIAPRSKNGHLVLIYGIRPHGNDFHFLIHNSTGFASNATQCEVEVSAQRFAECFSGRGVAVSAKA